MSKNFIIQICDFDAKNLKFFTKKYPKIITKIFDVNDKKQREKIVINQSIVISMLPAKYHFLIAIECLKSNINLVTASYISDELMKLDYEVKKKNLLFLNEVGLDPGLDHMSALKLIKEIKNENGKIKSFKSHCGGLIHPKYDNNPWNYKFTWNPRNVVLAAKGQAKFLKKNKIVQVNYPDVFNQTEKINIDQLGDFDSYANRDSLKYIKLYGLDEIDTMFRGTLRRKGFCESWEIIALLGLTDDEVYLNTFNKSYKDLILSQLFNKENVIDLKKEIELKVSRKISEETYNKLLWTELFTCNRKLKNEKMTLAQVVESLLVKKWNFEEKDKDMIVMQHDFEYQKNNRLLNKKSTLVVYGDENFSAMSKTVGLPLAIATKLILENKINYYGVKIPDISMIYEPILKELEDYKINFNESVVEV
jgi:saccharopine dehydrogenase-like NADP-dependent oxidoreductase